MDKIRLIGRGSRLSRLQMELVKNKIESVVPGIIVDLVIKESKGDALQDIPLQTVEGSDFFTREIFDSLEKQEADIAVHSLKDMSSEHFFGENHFAVVDRDDTRDVAIFRNTIGELLATGKPIVIGTCSPRREEMATGFLQKALPWSGHEISITTRFIRGNVDTRLRKLDAGEYDAIILATAGLNRLLKSSEDGPVIKELLANKRLMILPLVECVPAPCQGAIVAEAHRSNKLALSVLELINDRERTAECIREKEVARNYGIGCDQRFGVTSFPSTSPGVTYAAGKSSAGNTFSDWRGLPRPEVSGKILFSSTDFMGSFFEYDYRKEEPVIGEKIVYIGNYKAVQSETVLSQLKKKKVWAAGTRTWYELARKGIWVEGSADAFGLEFLEAAWSMPLIDIRKTDVRIITSEEGSGTWEGKQWKTTATYSLQKKTRQVLADKIANADIIFWTSFQQYDLYKDFVKPGVLHLCPFGETALQLQAGGLTPVVFPTIKAFQQWKKNHFPLPSEG